MPEAPYDPPIIGVNSESDSDSSQGPATRVLIPPSARSTRSLIDVEQEVTEGNAREAQMEKDSEDERREVRRMPSEADVTGKSKDMEDFLAQVS